MYARSAFFTASQVRQPKPANCAAVSEVVRSIIATIVQSIHRGQQHKATTCLPLAALQSVWATAVAPSQLPLTQCATDKSNKKIAPKAQAQRRRPAAAAAAAAAPAIAASERSSARASVERRDASQTSIPAATRPAPSSSPAPIPSHGESQTTSQLSTRPPAAEEIRTITASGGVPIICVSGESSTGQPMSQAGSLTAVSYGIPAQEPIPTTEEARDTDSMRAKAIPTTGLSPGPSVVRDSLPAATEDNTNLESTFAALREALSGQEQQHQSANKRRRLDRPRISKESPLTANVSEGSVAIVSAVERDRGPEMSADGQPAAGNDAPGRTAMARGRRKAATTAGGARPDIEQTNGTSALKRKGEARARAKGRSTVGADPTDDGEHPSALGRKGSSRNRRQKRAREKTPEDAENVEIASSVVKMSDLCKDTRTGKRSERSREIEMMDGTETIRKQRERREVRENGRPPTLETVDQRLERLEREREAAEQGQVSAPRMRLVNGKLVLDEASLQVDRHANAAALAEPMEQVEESTLTRPVNAGTWGKREKTEPWGEESTDRFYNALRMFGTDFGMISKMFPGRSRRQIKLKFNKEEKADSKRVTEAVSGPRQLIDIAEFSELTMTEYQDPEAFARELEAEAAAHAAEQKRQQEALQETIRQTHAVTGEVAADGAGGSLSAKENQVQGSSGASKKGKRAADKKKKNLHSRHGGGEEVEVIGTIDIMV
ncbi:MAG: Transcription factor TFIIIB component B [Geoglossum simile]|nr:MAG: Transcription factor TFIIIB component B [Geoglossum simile]